MSYMPASNAGCALQFMVVGVILGILGIGMLVGKALASEIPIWISMVPVVIIFFAFMRFMRRHSGED